MRNDIPEEAAGHGSLSGKLYAAGPYRYLPLLSPPYRRQSKHVSLPEISTIASFDTKRVGNRKCQHLSEPFRSRARRCPLKRATHICALYSILVVALINAIASLILINLFIRERTDREDGSIPDEWHDNFSRPMFHKLPSIKLEAKANDSILPLATSFDASVPQNAVIIPINDSIADQLAFDQSVNNRVNNVERNRGKTLPTSWTEANTTDATVSQNAKETESTAAWMTGSDGESYGKGKSEARNGWITTKIPPRHFSAIDKNDQRRKSTQYIDISNDQMNFDRPLTVALNLDSSRNKAAKKENSTQITANRYAQESVTPTAPRTSNSSNAFDFRTSQNYSSYFQFSANNNGRAYRRLQNYVIKTLLPVPNIVQESPANEQNSPQRTTVAIIQHGNSGTLTTATPDMSKAQRLIIDPSSSSSNGENQPKTAYSAFMLVDCSHDVDEKGGQLCEEWRRAGYCESHLATRLIFCRRECTCNGSEELLDV